MTQKSAVVQDSFTSGELSPNLAGFIAFPKFRSGVARLENFVPLQQGALTRRPGFTFVDLATEQSAPSRLIPFTNSTGSAFVLELSNLTMRVFKNKQPVFNSSGYAYFITTPYTTAQLSKLSFAQVEDVLFIASPDHYPAQIAHYSDTDWVFSQPELIDGPYADVNTSPTTLIAANADLSSSLTSSAALFSASSVGQLIRVYNSRLAAWAWCKIVSYSSDTLVSITAEGGELPNTVATDSPTANWRLGVFGGVTALGVLNGFPAQVAVVGQRLLYSTTTTKTTTLWGSKPNRVFLDFAPTALNASTPVDTDAITMTLASGRSDAIYWMIPKQTGLWVGTAGAVWSMPTTGIDSPTTVGLSAAKEDDTSSEPSIKPIAYKDSVLFVEGGARKISTIGYDWRVRGLSSKDITLLAEHITAPGLSQIAFAAQPNSTMWALRTDGVLLSATYNTTENEIGFARHISSVIESLAVIPYEGEDQLWVEVLRGTVRSIEVLEPLSNPLGFLDSQVSYVGAPTTLITQLDHLNGDSCGVVADGEYLGLFTPASGSITLPHTASDVLVGLVNVPILETLTLAREAVSLGVEQKIVGVYLNLLSSWGVEVNGREFIFRDAKEGLGTDASRVTGTYRFDAHVGFNRDPSFTITCPRPFACTIRNFVAHISTGTA